MTKWGRLVWPALVTGGLVAVLNCGGNLPGGLKVPDVPGVPGACTLDVTKPEAIAEFDFEKEFALKADVAAKIKAATVASVEIKAFADQIDADLKTACGGISKDLGGTDDGKTGEEQCKLAIKAIGDFKAKLGANAKVVLDIQEPKCGVDMDAYAQCAGKCDASVSGGSAKVECEPGKLQGECSAKCSGTCEAKAAMKCDGKCGGSCDAGFSGTCGGTCDGKCDGKNTKGACSGKCEGKCDAQANGSCTGQCTGSCEAKGEMQCNGTCTGKCSVEMKAPKCTGEMTPPKVNAECKASCDAKLNAKVECTPARVAVLIQGTADAKMAEQFSAALEKNLPVIIKVSVGMGKRAGAMANGVVEIVNGAKATVETMASAGGSGQAALNGAKLAGCVVAPFKGAIDAAASIKANVSVSASVSASASGSAGGSAKTLR